MSKNNHSPQSGVRQSEVLAPEVWNRVLEQHADGNVALQRLLRAYRLLHQEHLELKRRCEAMSLGLEGLSYGLMLIEGSDVVWANSMADQLLGTRVLEGAEWSQFLADAERRRHAAKIATDDGEVPALGVPVLEGRRILVAIAGPEGSKRSSAATTLASLWSLTDREATVASMMVSGMDSHQIADGLGVGFETARSHIKHVLRKLERPRQVDGVATLVRSAAAWSKGA